MYPASMTGNRTNEKTDGNCPIGFIFLRRSGGIGDLLQDRLVLSIGKAENV